VRWTFVLLLVSPYFIDVAWQKLRQMRFNFLKLLDKILLYLSRRQYVITSVLMTSRLRHHYAAPL